MEVGNMTYTILLFPGIIYLKYILFCPFHQNLLTSSSFNYYSLDSSPTISTFPWPFVVACLFVLGSFIPVFIISD